MALTQKIETDNSVFGIKYREIDQVASILMPFNRISPCVFASPHSGTNYSREFINSSCLNVVDLRRSEDRYVNELFQLVPQFGAPLISALFPRAFIDVNREPYELDPSMFSGAIPSYVNTSSDRAVAGFGTIPRLVEIGMEIYGSKMPFSDAEARIEKYYKPYHVALKDLILETKHQFGFAILVDCHSMPSSAVEAEPKNADELTDIVLGDLFGTSCSPKLTNFVESTLINLGFKVRRNKPYAGAYTTACYGKPLEGFHAMQIEINRRLYIREENFVRSSNIEDMTNSFGKFAKFMSAYDKDDL